MLACRPGPENDLVSFGRGPWPVPRAAVRTCNDTHRTFISPGAAPAAAAAGCATLRCMRAINIMRRSTQISLDKIGHRLHLLHDEDPDALRILILNFKVG